VSRVLGDLAAFVERLEDALVQADEVDGRLLQFEGGLSVTSVVLTGAAALAQKAKKPLPLTGDQMVKFANYLMSRRSVQQVKVGNCLCNFCWVILKKVGRYRYLGTSRLVLGYGTVPTN